jgi:hypothetical protein
MRRYKVVACILLILSVFSLALAAPVAVRGARTDSDAVDGSDIVTIRSEKRTEEETQPLLGHWQQEEMSSPSDWSSTPSQLQGSSSTPNFASGVRPNPSFSSGVQPGTSTEIQSWRPAKFQPVTSSLTKIRPPEPSLTKSVSWAPLRGVSLPSGEIYREGLPPDTEIKQPLPPSPGPSPPPSPPPERESDRAIMKSLSQRPQQPQSKNTNTSKFKKMISKLKLGKVKFWR